nr:DoxX family protein [Insulibacter thermoxylanivorax]
MMVKFLRENIYAAGILLILRVYLGWSWLTAGWNKLIGGFNAEGYLKNVIANPVMKGDEVIYPTYTAFLEHFALPNVKLINFLIPVGEFLVGLGLILGALTAAAAFFGLLMNFMFLFAGTISTNPWMVLIGGIIFMAGHHAGRFGIDYYLMPFLRKVFARKGKTAANQDTAVKPGTRPAV